MPSRSERCRRWRATQTAALIVIGNEILSGKVVDTNSAFLAQELRALGVALRRIVVIPDEVDVIAEAVRAMQPTVDVLFTSGGVGPTHDDVTIAGIARGLGDAVVRHPALEHKLREYFGDSDQRRAPEDGRGGRGHRARVSTATCSFPTFRVENIYILPGIPEIFRDKVLALQRALRERSVPPARRLYARDGERDRGVLSTAPWSSFPSCCWDRIRS